MTVDLHLHTTASDGRCTPGELVALAADAGLAVMAVTDHDTVAAVRDVCAHASARGIEAIAGIEITSVIDGRDVHVLGYFLDPEDRALAHFLEQQRARRIERVEALRDRLATLGMPIDTTTLLADARQPSGRSIGRPQVARAMIAAGYVRDTDEAFDRWLGVGCPAFVARIGPSPEAVIDSIHEAGGLASLAHPGRTAIDEGLPWLREAGLDALEVYHSDHDAALVERYARMTHDLGLLATGGSDFHGDPTHGRSPGSAGLPDVEWTRLRAARDRHSRGR